MERPTRDTEVSRPASADGRSAVVPTTCEEAAIQTQDVKRRDHVWLEPGAATVRFGMPASADPQDVRGIVLTKRP